jgi:5-methyltetrahydrofolate--homocysteine methyltransferase
MNKTDLRTALASRPLICDGAMGTQLMARGLPSGACGEEWNIKRPAEVEAIQRAYREAGCDLLTTNTFGASSAALDRHGLADRVAEINRAGAEIASRAAGAGGWVLGDVGPFGGFLEPVGDMLPEKLLEIFKEQVAALSEGGADAIIIETMSDPAEMTVAIEAARAASTRPIIATYAFAKGDGQSFRTMMGTNVADAIDQAIDAGADVVGANCGTALDLSDYLRLAEQIAKCPGKAGRILQPNAGSPQTSEGKLVYPGQPADMAAIVAPLLKMGFGIIGGCCGTTPEHLKAMAGAAK